MALITLMQIITKIVMSVIIVIIVIIVMVVVSYHIVLITALAVSQQLRESTLQWIVGEYSF